MKNETIGNWETAGAMTLAGCSVAAGKILAGDVPVFTIGFYSLAAALLVLVPVQLFRLRELRALKLRDLTDLAPQAVFGIVLFRIFMLTGLKFTTALNAGLITSATPAVLTFLSFMILREKLSVRQIFSVLLAVAGILMIQLVSLRQNPEGSRTVIRILAGNLLVFGAVVCEALLTIFRKKPEKKIDCITNTTVLTIISLLMMTPLYLAERKIGNSIPEWNSRSLAAILVYGPGATALGYILWGDGAVRIPAARVGIFTSLIPVTATVLSLLILKEKFLPIQAAAAVAVTLSIFFGTVKSIFPLKKKKLPAPS